MMLTVLAFLLLIAIGGVLILVFRLSAQRKRISALDAENQRLAKWTSVADADARAAELIQSAQAILDKATNEATTLTSTSQRDAAALLTGAKDEAGTLESSARQDAKKLKDEARRTLDSATLQAGTIVDEAHKRAEEIAGSAYEAMKNASLYEQTVKAMRNLIEGYGNQYIVPARSLLDDLADEFGYTQAGEELKKARERTKLMIRNATAATCELRRGEQAYHGHQLRDRCLRRQGRFHSLSGQA